MSNNNIVMEEGQPRLKRSMGQKAANRISNTVIYILLIVISVIWLLPFIFIVLQSFRVETRGPVGYVAPHTWGFDNYQRLWTSNFKTWYLNTFIIALVVAALGLMIADMTIKGRNKQ